MPKEVYSAFTRDYPNAKAWTDDAPYCVPRDKTNAEVKFGGALRTVSVSHTVHFNPNGSLAVTYLIVYATP
jgi:hypothetical protein